MSSETQNREPAGLPFERDIQEMERKLADLEMQAGDDLDISAEVDALRGKLREKLAETYSGLSAWDQVTVARHPDRPVTTGLHQRSLRRVRRAARRQGLR